MGTKSEEIAKANVGEGCLGKAHSDEPIFILRAQDRFAPGLLEVWSENVAKMKGFETDKTREARAIAHDMRAWQARNFIKTPD